MSETKGSKAREGRATERGPGVKDEGETLTLQLPVTIAWETGMPADTPAAKLHMAAATKGLFFCEGLFWAVARLSEPSGGVGSESRPAEYFEALEYLGIIGRAVAAGVREELDKADLQMRR